MCKLESGADIYDTVAKNILNQPQESRRDILDKIHLELEFSLVMLRIYENIIINGEDNFKAREDKHVCK